MKQTFLALLVLAAGCSREPEPPAKVREPPSSALDLYDVTLSTDSVSKGEQVSFCFKAHNAVMVTGFPGKFSKNGALDGDCLVHAPEVDTLYRLEVTGADGTKRTQTAFVKMRK